MLKMGFMVRLRLLERSALNLSSNEETSGAHNALDGCQVAVQSAVASQRRDVLPQVTIRTVHAATRSKGPVKVDPLAGTECFAGEDAAQQPDGPTSLAGG